jgi:hypothetical protein
MRKIFQCLLLSFASLFIITACNDDQLYDRSVLETTFKVSSPNVSTNLTVENANIRISNVKLTGTRNGIDPLNINHDVAGSEGSFSLVGTDPNQPLRLSIDKGQYDSLTLEVNLAQDTYNLILRDSIPAAPSGGDTGGETDGDPTSGEDGDNGGDSDSGSDDNDDGDDDDEGSGDDEDNDTGSDDDDNDDESGPGNNDDNDDDDDNDNDDGEEDDDDDNDNDEGDDDDNDNVGNDNNKDDKDEDKNKDKDKNKDNDKEKDKGKDNKGEDKKGKDKKGGRAEDELITLVDLDGFFANAKPSLFAALLYQRGTKQIRVLVSIDDFPQLVFRDSGPFVVTEVYGNSALAQFDIALWFSKITTQELESANIVRYQGQNLLLIHRQFNKALYQKIIQQVRASVSLQVSNNTASATGK